MFGADNPSGSCVLLAGRAVVWACLPVSTEEQAREVLRRRDYGRALQLIEQGLAQGEGWAEVASAQAALCLLHGAHSLGTVVGKQCMWLWRCSLGRCAGPSAFWNVSFEAA